METKSKTEEKIERNDLENQENKNSFVTKNPYPNWGNLINRYKRAWPNLTSRFWVDLCFLFSVFFLIPNFLIIFASFSPAVGTAYLLYRSMKYDLSIFEIYHLGFLSGLMFSISTVSYIGLIPSLIYAVLTTFFVSYLLVISYHMSKIES
jgi:hypothetical protein